jgi:hypothetical protein
MPLQGTLAPETLTSGYFDPLMLRVVMLIGSDRGAVYRASVRSGVSASTIGNWQKGKTHRPNAATLRFVARSSGYDLELVKRKNRRTQ